MGELEEGGAVDEEVGGGLSDEEPADGLSVDFGGRVEDVEEEADAGDVAGFGETGEGVGAGGVADTGAAEDVFQHIGRGGHFGEFGDTETA